MSGAFPVRKRNNFHDDDADADLGPMSGRADRGVVAAATIGDDPATPRNSVAVE